MEKIAGIYLITSPTNKFYVGQSWNIEKRFNAYRKLKAKGQPYLMNSLLKYGSDKHKFSILKTYEGELQSEMDSLELENWKIYKNLGFETLNCREPNGSKGKLSEETKNKIGTINKGKIPHNKGVKLTEEQKLKRPKTNIGRIASLDTKIKLSEVAKGENNPSAKLTKENVTTIKKLLTSDLKQIEIAKLFNVSKQTISSIKLEINWK